LTKYKDRQIAQLSGGQQQRVFIARALAQKADIYLMDEPFVGVDAATENSILKLLKEMRDLGKTVLIIHHDLQTVSDYFDYLVLLNTRLIAKGTPQEVLTEENLTNAYGGQLTLLAKVANLIKVNQFPIREKDVDL
jgi:manganese/zinc/iron transport system ATP- binding protein